MSPTAVHELCFRCVAHLYCNKAVSYWLRASGLITCGSELVEYCIRT